MNSRDAQKLYSGYLEGELSADEEDALRSYLAESPEAAADYRAFEATVEMLRALPKEEANEEMTTEIMSRVRRARTRTAAAPVTGRSTSRVRQLLPLAAVLVLGFVMTFVMLNARRDTGGAEIAGGATTDPGEGPAALVSGEEIVPKGEALSESFDRLRYDRPLRQVDTGSESPSIVF
jgi:ferric-dicitrate binding protein FerR (iron transport regulator)